MSQSVDMLMAVVMVVLLIAFIAYYMYRKEYQHQIAQINACKNQKLALEQAQAKAQSEAQASFDARWLALQTAHAKYDNSLVSSLDACHRTLNGMEFGPNFDGKPYSVVASDQVAGPNFDGKPYSVVASDLAARMQNAAIM